jgi:hypothetical protein
VVIAKTRSVGSRVTHGKAPDCEALANSLAGDKAMSERKL